MASAVSLADTSRFYDALAIPTVATACEDLSFPQRVLALELQVHAVPGLLRQEGAYGNPCQALISLLAGSRRANNLARAVVYR
eukprot:6419088-Pyramimonas_sp.AAC.1